MLWMPRLDDELACDTSLPALLSPITASECVHLAYRLALQGAGFVHLNPMVGAVLVDKEHRFLAAGAHLEYGQAHAEANLLDSVRQQGLESKLAEATLYCTLEPCAFHGKTPACALSLAKLPLKTLVYGVQDPHPQVNGRGLAILEAAGMICRQDQELARLGERLCSFFAWSQRSSSPFVGLKAAISLDGMIAQNHSERLWITGERARQYGHWLRQLYDAVLVGAETVLCDNPQLNIRHPGLKRLAPPWKVVLDPRGRAWCARPWHKQNLLAAQPERCLWVFGEGFLKSKLGDQAAAELQACGAIGMSLPLREQGFDLDLLQEALRQRQMASLLLEGGRKLWAAFLNAGMVRRLHVFQAPRLLGASDGVFWAEGFRSCQGPWSINRGQLSPLGGDWLIEGELG